MEVNRTHYAPAVLLTGMHSVNDLIGRCIGSRVSQGVVKKETFLLLLVFETRTVQPVYYTD
jgi:hypothetical protein